MFFSSSLVWGVVGIIQAIWLDGYVIRYLQSEFQYRLNLEEAKPCSSVALLALFYEENQGLNPPPHCCNYRIIKNLEEVVNI
jgi:hypothetical protein